MADQPRLRMPEGQIPENRPRSRVLVVDDDYPIRELVCRFLDRFRYDVSPAENGRQALEMFREKPFDLVVTDLHMPVMDGLDLMARLEDLAPGTPVVVITGLDRGTVKRMDGITAAAAVFYKPFDLNHLGNAIGDLLPV